MTSAIRMRGVTKTFGEKTAVDNLELAVPEGGLYGFIGPNGAGKTTSIRMIMSILFPDSGELEVLGHASALEAKDRIGYLPEERGVYKKMKVADYLKYIGRLKEVPEKALARRIETLLDRVELPDVGPKRCEELSKGMLQKIQFSAAIIHEPELLILDEPFSGLDPVSMRLLRDQIVRENARGATILFSTHVMQQAEEICEHILMIHKGRKVLDDPIASIRNRYDPNTVFFEPFEADADVSSLDGAAGIAEVIEADDGFEASLAPGAAPADAMRAITRALSVSRIELKRPSLEDVFVQIVSESSQTSVSELREELRAGTLQAEEEPA